MTQTTADAERESDLIRHRAHEATVARIAELEAALLEIAEGELDDGGYRRNHVAATALARKVLGLED